MVERDQIEEAIIDSFQIDETGLKDVKVVDIAKVQTLGVKDVPAFLQGVLDAENENDVENTSDDYVKGYRYGATGTF